MKVLKNADVAKVVCKSCNSVLEITRDDIEYFYHFGHNSYLYVVCGACRRRVGLSKSQLPADWQEHIKAVILAECGDDN